MSARPSRARARGIGASKANGGVSAASIGLLSKPTPLLGRVGRRRLGRVGLEAERPLATVVRLDDAIRAVHLRVPALILVGPV